HHPAHLGRPAAPDRGRGDARPARGELRRPRPVPRRRPHRRRVARPDRRHRARPDEGAREVNAMRTVAIRDLRSHKVRLALTLISVVLGTAFVAGSFVFTDTLKHSFDTIFATSDKGIDTRVQAVHGYQAGVPTGLVGT